QLFDLFRSFRFSPTFVEFCSSVAAKRLEVGALRASHWLIFCYPLVGIFLRIECRGRHIWRNIVCFHQSQILAGPQRWPCDNASEATACARFGQLAGVITASLTTLDSLPSPGC